MNIRKLLKLGVPLVPNSLLLMLLTCADRYILNIYSGLAVVGVYTVGYRFSQIIDRFIVGPFGKALSPVLFQQYASSKDKYKNTIEMVFKYYWLVIFGVIIIYFVFLKEVFSLLISNKYIEGFNIIPIVLLGIVIWGITNLLGITIIMKEKTNKMFLFTFISVALNIGLNFVLVPKFGIYGAAMATFISYLLQFVMIFIYTQKLIFINYDYAFVFKSIVFSACFLILVIFLSYLNINLWLRLGLKATSFLLFVLLSYKLVGGKVFVNKIKKIILH